MKKLFLFITVLLFALSFSSVRAWAETIHSFNVALTAHKDGIIDISETINYDFENSSRHGIYRDIPLYSKVGDLYRIIKVDNVSVLRDGIGEKFDTSQTKEQISFKIGNPDREITGAHVYKITYTVENGIGSNFPQHDEIYWNATGNGWEVDIEKASISFSNDFGAKEGEFKCFTGELGSAESNCEINGVTVSSSNLLYPGQGLSSVATYSKGTFPPSILSKELPKSISEKTGEIILRNLGLIWLLLNIVLPLGLIIWYEKHKNKKRFGKPVVNFDVPKDEKGDRLAPAISGTIDTAKLERDDVVATIFDLAIRKYIKLEEIKTKRSLLPDSTTQKIIKLKEKDEKLTKFEETLFDRLFEESDEVEVDKLKKDFYQTFSDMEEDVFSFLVDKKYFVRNPKIQTGFLLVLGLLSLITLSVPLGIVLIFLSKKLIGRTSLGDELDFKIDGLKLFLKSMNRNYKWQAEKFYTVEQMIPYAMSLGYIDKFMEQLKIINPDYNPSWYSGYRGNFYLACGAFYSSIGSNITTSAPSSSSGFSGGSSGGGGGGGGGGSW